jgi:chemotaxis protein CheZ
MSAVAAAVADTPDLESLFDSIVAANAEPVSAARVEPKAVAGAAPVPAEAGGEEVITRLGKLTRSLHEGLRELGYDKKLESAAAAIPDTRDRLSYVANMTEQAAQRALTASETAGPIQDKLAADAGALSLRWEQLFAADPGADELKALVAQTREYLGQVPLRTRETQAQLTEIMLAQDFQDLTGQVIKKVTEVVHTLEGQLLTLLVENAPADKAQDAGGLLNGPVINGNGRSDVVTNQKQVDELLESLGF